MVHRFNSFNTDISSITLPEKFTFPFYYQPHPIAIIAAKTLQDYLTSQPYWNELFGLSNKPNQQAIGKMFGVMVVEDEHHEIGFIAAVSGNFSTNHASNFFVPPVFNIYNEDGFYAKGTTKIANYITSIERLEKDTNYVANKHVFKTLQLAMHADLEAAKKRGVKAKKERDAIRDEARLTTFGEDFTSLCTKLKQESANHKFYLKHLTEHWNEKLAELTKKITPIEKRIECLNKERQQFSANLQQQLFESYNFLNANGESKNLIAIFEETSLKNPPAAAGECAAPKLLQHAFKHHLKPISMAEFWWGASPKSEIRKHKNFYPACQSKCKPILGHMLQGLKVDENPMINKTVSNLEIQTIYEDEHLVVINKPAELLSVPGITIKDSVQERMKAKYPKATGPLTVHRLDMQTSGIMLIAKTLPVHKELQKQFMDRTIKKRYVALLDGVMHENHTITQARNGIIDLPLRPDLTDRPRQMVCFEHGKKALTKWEIINHSNGKTRIHFYPVTGRTHQLRVHAAHHLGLNTPILGDDMYGKFANRLHLHADFIAFKHPITRNDLKFSTSPDF